MEAFMFQSAAQLVIAMWILTIALMAWIHMWRSSRTEKSFFSWFFFPKHRICMLFNWLAAILFIQVLFNIILTFAFNTHIY